MPCQFCHLFIHFSPLLGNEKKNACHSPLRLSRETEKDKGNGDCGRGSLSEPAQRGWWWDPGEEAGVFPGKRGSLEGWSAEPRRRGLCVHTFVHVCARVWMCVRADTRPLVTSVVREYHKTTQRNRALSFHDQGSWERHIPLTEYSLHTLGRRRLAGALLVALYKPFLQRHY